MAITLTKNFQTIMGDKIVGAYTLGFDGTANGVSLPVAVIDFAFIPGSVGTSVAGTSISWSGSALNFADVLETGQSRIVFFVGY